MTGKPCGCIGWENCHWCLPHSRGAGGRLNGTPTIDCQDCGVVLRKLTDAQAQQVAANPYNFIAYCNTCQKEPS